jgi:S-(hydroxymethyl)glutathione dehydrogenase / alcohol dehydrogenase
MKVLEKQLKFLSRQSNAFLSEYALSVMVNLANSLPPFRISLEFLATGAKLHGGAMGAVVMATQAVRKCGTIQLTGVYGGRYNGFPLGDIFARNVNIKAGQAPVIPYMQELYNMLAMKKIDPSDIVTHKLPLDRAEYGYEVFDTKTDGCIKVILKP